MRNFLYLNKDWQWPRLKLAHRPIDIRIFIILVFAATIYKCLSKDFSALEVLCDRAPIYWFPPNWLYNLVSSAQCGIYQEAIDPRSLQLVVAVLLLLCIAFPKRLLFASAFLALLVLDTSGFLWRANMWDLDTPLVILFILIAAPVRLQEATAFRNVDNRHSAALGLMIILFVSAYYFLAFLSKLVFDPAWVLNVNIGNYYSISTLMHGQQMPGWLSFFAAPISNLMVQYAILDDFAALVVLIEQFLWILAPFILFIRYHAGLFSVAYHLFVFIATGIMFFTWTAIALGISIPWGRAWDKYQEWKTGQMVKAHPDGSANTGLANWQWSIVLAVPLAIAFLPPLGYWMPPFYNYMQFGWRYPSMDEIKTVYSVGRFDRETNEFKRFPLNHGGFIEFRHSNTMDIYVRSILNNEGSPAITDIRGLQTLLIATRKLDADGWVFGDFRAPDHLVSERGTTDMTEVENFYLLRGTVISNTENRPAEVRWEACGQVFPERQTAETVELYDTCKSTLR